jgi:uncharacterized RDD family membrane protein YckC
VAAAVKNETPRGAIDLVTPEGASLRFELATGIERAAAFLVDVGIIICLFILTVVALASLAVMTTSESMIALLILFLFLIRQFYFMAFELAWQGATPGKRALSVRVLSRDGGRLSIEAIVARNVLRDLELFVPLAVVFGPENVVGQAPWWLWIVAIGWVFLVMLLPVITRERTRAGDLVGGTIVVRVPKATLLEDEAADPHAGAITFTREQLAVYGEHELETLATILRDMDRAVTSQSDLRTIAKTIAKKVGFVGAEPERNPALFLREFYREQRADLERRLVLGKRKASKLDV